MAGATKRVSKTKKSEKVDKIYNRVHTLSQHGTDMLQVNTLLMYRWEIFAKLGEGSHSQVYAAFDRSDGKDVAIKTDTDEKRLLSEEANILKKLTNFDNFCKYIYHQMTFSIHFLVMELQGPSLNEIALNYNPLSLDTVMKIGLQMIDAIQAVHSIGYLHCDIKPGNFATGMPPHEMHKIFLIDFSLSSRYVNKFNQIIQRDQKSGYPGTMKYVSPVLQQTHKICRRDDLFSMLYTLLELRTKLPWGQLTCGKEVLDQKLTLTHDLISQYIDKDFVDFKEYLETLKFEDAPDYGKLRGCMNNLFTELNLDYSKRVEWESKPDKIWRECTVLPYSNCAISLPPSENERLKYNNRVGAISKKTRSDRPFEKPHTCSNIDDKTKNIYSNTITSNSNIIDITKRSPLVVSLLFPLSTDDSTGNKSATHFQQRPPVDRGRLKCGTYKGRVIPKVTFVSRSFHDEIEINHSSVNNEPVKEVVSVSHSEVDLSLVGRQRGHDTVVFSDILRPISRATPLVVEACSGSSMFSSCIPQFHNIITVPLPEIVIPTSSSVKKMSSEEVAVINANKNIEDHNVI